MLLGHYKLWALLGHRNSSRWANILKGVWTYWWYLKQFHFILELLTDIVSSIRGPFVCPTRSHFIGVVCVVPLSKMYRYRYDHFNLISFLIYLCQTVSFGTKHCKNEKSNFAGLFSKIFATRPFERFLWLLIFVWNLKMIAQRCGIFIFGFLRNLWKVNITKRNWTVV